jgi:hypothetical protein
MAKGFSRRGLLAGLLAFLLGPRLARLLGLTARARPRRRPLALSRPWPVPAGPARAVTYTYDHADRLVCVAEHPEPGPAALYDAGGNPGDRA